MQSNLYLFVRIWHELVFDGEAHELLLFIICSINKHILIGPDAYPLDSIKLHITLLPDVKLQSTLHEVISYGLREVTSERQVISHDPSVTSMVPISRGARDSKIGKKWPESSRILDYILS